MTTRSYRHIPFFLGLLALIFAVSSLAAPATAQSTQTVLSQYLSKLAPGDLVAGADAYGPINENIAVAPILSQGEEIGFAFVTSDFVGTTGYSGKPIHTMVAIDRDARVLGVELVKHYEPIVLIGIPDSKIKAMVAGYRGLDLVARGRRSE